MSLKSSLYKLMPWAVTVKTKFLRKKMEQDTLSTDKINAETVKY